MFRRASNVTALLFVGSIPLDVWPVSGIGSVSTLAGVVLGAAALLHFVTTAHVRPAPAALKAAALFAAWSWASVAWSWDPDTTVQRSLTYSQLLVVTWILWQLVRTVEQVEYVAAAFLVGCFVAAVGTYIQYARGAIYDADVRYATSGFDPNDLGLTLAIALPLAWMLGTNRVGRKSLLWLTYVPLSLGAIALTASRGAALAGVTAASIVVFGARHLRARAKLLTVAVGGAALAFLVRWVPAESWERLWTIKDQLSGGSFTHRKEIWRAGFGLFADNWLFGVGAGGFPHAVEPLLNWRIVAHNTFLGVATELGVVGLLLFLAPFLFTIRRLRHLPTQWRASLAVLLMTWMVGASSLTWDTRKTTWFVAFLGVIAWAAGRAAAHPLVVARSVSVEEPARE
jgi:O-antigen ligase